MTCAAPKTMHTTDIPIVPKTEPRTSLSRFRTRCASCNLREVCLPCGLPTTEVQNLGEIVGMDGIGTDHHAADVTALEDSEVCVIPYARLEEAGLQRQLHRVMSRELVRDQGVMMLLGTMRAEERLAAFLLNLSQRFTARGYSPNEFHLRMKREEIGSYLGLSLETVSRLFSRFQSEGLVAVQQKHIRILDVAGLRSVMLPERPSE